MAFTPIELTDENVQAIFNEIAVEENERSTPVRLYSEENEPNVDFDFEGLKAHSKEIEYLVGQLKTVHAGEKYIKIPDIAVKYTGKSWVKDKAAFMKIIFLGIAISKFSKVMKTNSSVLNHSIIPTLSPSDPNFEIWWAEHKSEWED